MSVTKIVVPLFATLALACARQAPTPSAESPTQDSVAPVDAPPKPALVADQPVTLEAPKADAKVLADARGLARVGETNKALALLKTRHDPAARYVRARILVDAQRFADAQATLETMDATGALASWVERVRADAQRGLGDEEAELRALEATFASSPALAREVTVRLAELRAERDPDALWAEREQHETALNPKDVDGRSRLLGALLRSLEQAPREGIDAETLAVERYLREPVSSHTPDAAPRALTSQERIERAESLLAAHRNERVLEEIRGLGAVKLDAEWECRRQFAHGLAARKLRKYREAREHLGRVISGSCDSNLKRRAHYLWAKVISIASGLAAVKPIEDFAKTYTGHSMVDDVLFWAGDMYQRRGRRSEAEQYYTRIEQMTPPGDQCAIARWRLAWMSYKARELDDAKVRLERLLKNDGCVDDAFDRARAAYWLGRVAERRGLRAEAAERFSEVLETDPFGFYAQVALTRIRTLDSERFAALARALPAPNEGALPELCPGALAEDPVFLRGWSLYEAGLYPEAAREWLTVQYEQTEVLSQAHAAALGRDASPLEVAEGREVEARCHADHPGLLLALLLSRAGEKAEAQWRLRTTYAAYFARTPEPNTAGLWLAAYPLEARQFIAPAEHESGLPSLFLQALSREESAFDDQVVSWAGAYGLTQLLLSTGQTAGRLLEPPV
ncbi:MAG: transglycosylase SLT domain-containing protein, partial [Myxococcota bacterium]